ncbi:MAG TPA: hypothetical protein VMW52_07875 [Phycisphaerae bacterium]|nr:hypothetical protein [Phycisphaerae bacterium]
MDIQMIAAGLGGLAVLLQAVNFALYLRIDNAILRSEAQLKDWSRREFVAKEACDRFCAEGL